MKVVFELSNYGGCAQLVLFSGKSGKQYTFTNDGTGTGFKYAFDGTPSEYLTVMRDLLGASHPFYKVYVHFVPEGQVVTPEILAHFEALTQRNEELEAQNEALSADLAEAKKALGRRGAKPAKSKPKRSAKKKPDKKAEPAA